MKNQLTFFKNDVGGHDFPPVILPWIVGGLMVVIGGIACTPPFEGMWAVYTLGLGLLTLLVSIVGYKTSIYRGLDSTGEDIWDTYQCLLPETRKRIGLTPEIILATEDIYRLNDEINELYRVQRQRIAQSGPVLSVRNNISAELEFEEKELEFHTP